MESIKYKLVNLTNYKDAINIQNSIFPKEDGTFNILESLNVNLFKEITGINLGFDLIKYYLMYENNTPIGITGLYQLQNFKNELWLGWFGINKEHRKKGYGEKLLKWTIEKAKSKKIKVLRLYTDYNDNAIAVKLYKKIGFVGEKYTNEKLDYDCRIYSLPLTEEKLELWNNRNAGISSNNEFENSLNKKEIFKLYDDYFKKCSQLKL